MEEKENIPITADDFIRQYRADKRDAAEADRLRAEVETILSGLKDNDSLGPMLRGLLRAQLSASFFCFQAERTLKNVYKELALRKEEAAELESARRWLADERETAARHLSEDERTIMEHLISGFRRWYSLHYKRKLKASDNIADASQNRMMILSPREFIGALKKIGAYPTHDTHDRQPESPALAAAV
jgi:hypothetical protein